MERDIPAPAAWAARVSESRGRRHAEAEHPYRSCWERDRDRIVHSRAFRRLEYKTQVFPNYEGDHFRTRLTHTIEVAQLARTVSRALRLEPMLAEPIALAHDLGHPPFGHIGEETLDDLLGEAAGFEHNRQALRIVEELEERYASFPGLNLTFEVREGIVKHTTRYDRYEEAEIREYRPQEQPYLEAQIIDWVDEIAYNVHDIDDGVEAHILDPSALAAAVPLFGRLWREQGAAYPSADDRGVFNETIRRLLDTLVTDLVRTTEVRLRDAGIDSVEAVRRHPERLVAQSERMRAELDVLGDYLFHHLYRAPRVHGEMERATRILRQLFEAYLADPALLPRRHRERIEETGKLQVVADYVAGMTDRYVLQEHRRITAPASRQPVAES